MYGENILDDLNNILNKQANHSSIRKYRNSRVAFYRARLDAEAEIIDIIEKTLEKYKGRSEIIKLLVSEGYFLDTGIETLKIIHGVIWEIYDYPTFTHYLIRLLRIWDENRGIKWIAVYIDENPDTAWWSDEERSELNR